MKCERCDGVGILPVTQTITGDAILPSRPCPQCKGSGTEVTYMGLCRMLRRTRQEADLSMRECADKANFSSMVDWQNMEDGTTMPTERAWEIVGGKQ